MKSLGIPYNDQPHGVKATLQPQVIGGRDFMAQAAQNDAQEHEAIQKADEFVGPPTELQHALRAFGEHHASRL